MRCRESVVDLVCLKRGCKVKLWAGCGCVSGQGGGKNLPRFAHRWPARLYCSRIATTPARGNADIAPRSRHRLDAEGQSPWCCRDLPPTRRRLAQRGARAPADGDAVADGEAVAEAVGEAVGVVVTGTGPSTVVVG